MVTLSLLRHGKSSWEDSDLSDHDRPLAAIGRRAAADVGAYIASHDLIPDLILCSSALRARETLDCILPKLGSHKPKVEIEPALYLAPATRMLHVVRQTPASVRHLLLLAHNPGLHGLALDLTGRGLRRDIASMAMKFPTCALAVLTFETDNWHDVHPAAGHLDRFVAPRSLA
jgi:phosphohistidine phosphatase